MLFCVLGMLMAAADMSLQDVETHGGGDTSARLLLAFDARCAGGRIRPHGLVATKASESECADELHLQGPVR